MPKSEKRRSGELSFLGMKMWRLRWKDTRLCFGNIRQTTAFLAEIAQHRIPRHTGDAMARVHLPWSNSDSWNQNQRHSPPKPQFIQPVTMSQLICPQSKVCHPDFCIYIVLFPVVNFSIMMHMPRIASVIKIWIQICWLMKEHPLVSTLSAAW